MARPSRRSRRTQNQDIPEEELPVAEAFEEPEEETYEEDYEEYDDEDFEASDEDFEEGYEDEYAVAEEYVEEEVVEEAPSRGRGRNRSRSRRGQATEEESGGSSRRSAGKSSRRSGRSSSKQSGKKSARQKKVLTPEERAERKAKQVTFLKGIAVFLLVVALIGGAFFVLNGGLEHPRLDEAKQILRDQEVSLKRMQEFLDDEDLKIDEAKEIYLAAEVALADEVFGGPVENPNPEDKRIADRAVAIQAYDLMFSFKQTYAEIPRAEQMLAAKESFRALTKRLQNVTEEDNLEGLHGDITDFIVNPADPGMEDNSIDIQARYGKLIDALTGFENRIKDEKNKRYRSATLEVVERARVDTAQLMNDHKYGEALGLLAQAKEQFPEADLASLKRNVENSADNKWESVKASAEGYYLDATAAGSSEDIREERREKAVELMQDVVDNFGVDKYVDEAKDLLSKYKG